MDFVIQSCYLLAFLGGSAAAWVVVLLSIKRASRDEVLRAPSAQPRQARDGTRALVAGGPGVHARDGADVDADGPARRTSKCW